jgi:hypothetical protein
MGQAASPLEPQHRSPDLGDRAPASEPPPDGRPGGGRLALVLIAGFVLLLIGAGQGLSLLGLPSLVGGVALCGWSTVGIFGRAGTMGRLVLGVGVGLPLVIVGFTIGIFTCDAKYLDDPYPGLAILDPLSYAMSLAGALLLLGSLAGLPVVALVRAGRRAKGFAGSRYDGVPRADESEGGSGSSLQRR